MESFWHPDHDGPRHLRWACGCQATAYEHEVPIRGVVTAILFVAFPYLFPRFWRRANKARVLEVAA